MSKSNPFDLPPPWNPGYALPQNVDDEGLERRAYTTAWAPRGSYDDPKVGTAGYAVPGYVKEEGYGRGAMVTRWAPRGTYYGPKVKHWLDKPTSRIVGATRLPAGAAKLKIETMAGVEQAMGNERAPLTAYGLKSAKALIDTVKMMPPDVRKKQLKLALDLIDPKLYRRAEDDAEKEAKLGVPADIALERGLAAAISYGLAKELVEAGQGKPIPKKSQLGAACALGDYPPVRTGYCWVPATATVPGHWERARATGCQYPQTGVTATSGPVTRECSATDPSGCPGGVYVASTSTGQQVVTKVTAPPPPQPVPAEQAFVNIGPFLIPVNAGAWRDHRALTAEKKAYVDENIAIAAKAGGVSIAEMKKGRYPFVKFKAGMSGEESWGLYYEEHDGTEKTSRGTTIPAGTVVSYHKIPADQASQLGVYESLGLSVGGALSAVGGAIKDVATAVGGAVWDVLKKIWKGIKWVTMKVVHFVVDAAKWVAKMTCKLVQTPGVVQGAQAVATVAPNPYTIGIAAGVTVTKMVCDYANKPDDAAAQEKAAAEAAAAAAAAAAAEEAARKKKMLVFGGVGIAAAAILILGSGGKKR